MLSDSITAPSFCQQISDSTWNLMLFIFPAVDIYQYHAKKHIQWSSLRLTSFEFTFNQSERVHIVQKSASHLCWFALSYIPCYTLWMGKLLEHYIIATCHLCMTDVATWTPTMHMTMKINGKGCHTL